MKQTRVKVLKDKAEKKELEIIKIEELNKYSSCSIVLSALSLPIQPLGDGCYAHTTVGGWLLSGVNLNCHNDQAVYCLGCKYGKSKMVRRNPHV